MTPLRRWMLALLYLSATLAAQVAHHHEPAGGHGAAHAQAGCDDPGAHWAAHTDTPDLSHAPDGCAACHFRAAAAYAPEPGVPAPIAAARPVHQPRAADGSPRIVLPISSRGPPAA